MNGRSPPCWQASALPRSPPTHQNMRCDTPQFLTRDQHTTPQESNVAHKRHQLSYGINVLDTLDQQHSNTSCSKLRGCESKESRQTNATRVAKQRYDSKSVAHHESMTAVREREYQSTSTATKHRASRKNEARC